MAKKKLSIQDFKTWCCNADWLVKSRANFRCKMCDGDVTMSVVLFADMLEREKKDNETKKK